jgi:hypothetical protein
MVQHVICEIHRGNCFFMDFSLMTQTDVQTAVTVTLPQARTARCTVKDLLDSQSTVNICVKQ